MSLHSPSSFRNNNHEPRPVNPLYFTCSGAACCQSRKTDQKKRQIIQKRIIGLNTWANKSYLCLLGRFRSVHTLACGCIAAHLLHPLISSYVIRHSLTTPSPYRLQRHRPGPCRYPRARTHAHTRSYRLPIVLSVCGSLTHTPYAH